MPKINLQNPVIDLWDVTREIELNLSGPIRMVHLFLPHLKTKKKAAILDVTAGIALMPSEEIFNIVQGICRCFSLRWRTMF